MAFEVFSLANTRGRGEYERQADEALKRQQDQQNTQWATGAMKSVLDNWGQPGALEGFMGEAQKRGMDFSAAGLGEGATKQGAIKLYRQLVTAGGGPQWQDVPEGQAPAGQRNLRTGEYKSGPGSISQPRIAGPLQEYNLYAEQERASGQEPMPYLDFAKELNVQQSSGRAGGTQEVVGTVGEKAIDAAFGKEYVTFTQGGGPDAMKGIAQLDSVLQALQSGKNITGPAIGSVPIEARTYINQDSVNAQQQVEEVVQRNLRIILGAQFTEKEGERLIARAYNPKLDESVNVIRLQALSQQMKLAFQAKVDAVKYFRDNDTLRGWQGQLPTIADFDMVFESISDNESGATQPDADGVYTVTGDEDYDLLPPGAQYRGPDGVLRVK